MSKTDDLIDMYAKLLAENRQLRACVEAYFADNDGTMPRWQVNQVCNSVRHLLERPS